MAEQGRIVMPTAGATGSRGRLTGDAVKLYNTSCRASYDPGSRAPPNGTGFTSNHRPALYYRPSMDHIDNPQFGLLLSDNFTSQTKQHYRPHIQPDYSGALPNVINKPRESGFHQLRSLLKTATKEEKTEYQRLFVPHRFTPTVTQNHVTMGPKGQSGFTEGTDLQLYTFQEKKSCVVEPPQNHSSVMKSDFMLPSLLQGAEARCSNQCWRESGFNRNTIAPFACPTSFLPAPQTKSNAPTEKIIGKKELTGFLRNDLNNQIFPNTPYGCSHFNTHYKSMFCHDADYENLKSGHTRAGIVNRKMDSGFSRRDMNRFIFRG